MKKLLFVMAILLVVPSLVEAKVPSNKWKMEGTLLNSVSFATATAPIFPKFGVNAKFGFGKGEGFFGYARLAVPSGIGFDLGLGAGYDLPLWYFSVGRMRDNISLGFTFDAGVSLGYCGAFYVDMIGLGAGGRMTYDISRNFGLVAEPIHLSFHFVGYAGAFGGYFATEVTSRIGFYYSL